MTIKVALAGAGAFGIKHIDGIKNIDGVEVVSLISRDSLVVDLRAGRCVLGVIEQERVLRAPGQLDLVAVAEQATAAGVLLEDLELLAPGHPDEVLRADPGEAGVGDDAAADQDADMSR